MDELDQVVAKLTKTAEYGYDVPVRISYGWTARKSREMHIVPQRIFRWPCPFEGKKIFLIFGFDAKIVGVCAAWNVACRRIAPPATLQTNFPTKYARAKNTASIIIKRQAGTRLSEFCWFLIKISLIGERQCTKTNVWVFLSGGSGRHDISW